MKYEEARNEANRLVTKAKYEYERGVFRRFFDRALDRLHYLLRQ
jgi:hypothetical protein